MTVFGPDWDDLTLEDLDAFLQHAPPEPLLWEAKEELRAQSVRKQVSGFANGHEIGYLILGAKQRDDGTWSLDGLKFPNADPPDAITNILANGGVTPYPDGLDVRAFSLGDDKHVAVMRVPPAPAPPCNTGGTVYERVSGKTIPVTDPLRLAALFDRGDGARERAAATAADAAHAALLLGRSHPPGDVQFALGLAADGYGCNLNTRPFTQQFHEGVRSSMVSVLAGNDPLVGPAGPVTMPAITQDAVLQRIEPTHRLGWSWLVRVSRDGAVGIHWTVQVQQTSLDEMVGDQIRRAWSSADEVLNMLAPDGGRYLHIIAAGGEYAPNEDGPREPPELARGPLTSGLSEPMLASIQRELERATGLFAFEEE
jgi:hypothetical protein